MEKVCKSCGGTGYADGGEVGDDEAEKDIHEEHDRDEAMSLPPETDEETEELERKKRMQAQAMGARQKKGFHELLRLRKAR